MRFSDVLRQVDLDELRARVDQVDSEQVVRALAKPRRDLSDFLALISPAASTFMDRMAQASRALTLRHFGRTIRLYVPLYVSNACTNACVYCHFRAGSGIPRITLTPEQLLEEARSLHRMGLRHILLVSGEAPREVDTELLCGHVTTIRQLFPSVSLEIYPQPEGGYAKLLQAGAVGIALYQETYHRSTYGTVHPAGAKADYGWRLDALDRAGEAGMPKLGLGALLGLHDWRYEAIALVLHAQHLMRRYWRAKVSVSVPRFRQGPGGFSPPSMVGDRDLLQLVLALRLMLAETPIVLSTRERAPLRDAFIPLGITQMSAGSRTEPGGYGHPCSAAGQFEVGDTRSVEEVAAAIAGAGYDPVWKDWDRNLSQGDGTWRSL